MPPPTAINLGHRALDEQHEAIFDLQSEALAALRSGDHEGGTMALMALEGAIADHFAFEEALMRESGYPDRAIHEDAHRLFAADLAKLAQGLAQGASAPATALWLDSRSGSWWRMHIRTNDASLARHVAAGRPPPPPAAPRVEGQPARK